MNLGDDGDSPWSDQRSTSPGQSNGHTAPDTEPASSKTPVRTPGGRSGRTPRKTAAQTTRLEAVNDATDPLLGPLGDDAGPFSSEPDVPPALPQKEPATVKSPRASIATSLSSRTRVEDETQPGSHARVTSALQSQSQPSISVEQAARPSFYITVGDPHKVGDLTGSHISYQVRTKTSSKAYRQTEFEVARRYRDFLWLYNQLHNNNPGIIVPPPPEKQAMGRYETDFVESRRAALERMLNKTAQHVALQHDADLKLFLESEAFNVDVKNRERKDSDMPPESKGFLGGLNISVGSGTKFIEHDDWFLERRVYLDTLETQLKGLLKATDSAVAQRKNLSDAAADLSTSLNFLSQVELSPILTGPLASLSDLHLRIRDLYARQALQDTLTLSTVIDEYIRLISSIKKAFEQRQKSWQGWHNAESDLQKRRSALDKQSRQGRSQQDKMATLQADVADAERRAHQARLTFEDLGRGMRAELERFEREKVEDFRAGVETYLESAVEAQKELIELWETYLMHLDVDEEEGIASEHGEAPPPPPSESTKTQPANPSTDEHTEHDEAAVTQSTGKPGTDASVAAAAAAAAELEHEV